MLPTETKREVPEVPKVGTSSASRTKRRTFLWALAQLPPSGTLPPSRGPRIQCVGSNSNDLTGYTGSTSRLKSGPYAQHGPEIFPAHKEWPTAAPWRLAEVLS